jgi:hypothetical protein
MLILSRPSDQGRLNAVIFELIGLNIHGTVCVPGNYWDCYDTLGYLEKRLKQPVIATHCVDGSEFSIRNKNISFTDRGVFITLYSFE